MRTLKSDLRERYTSAGPAAVDSEAMGASVESRHGGSEIGMRGDTRGKQGY